MKRKAAAGALALAVVVAWIVYWRSADERFVRSHFAVPSGIRLASLDGSFRPPPGACSFVWSRTVQATFELTAAQAQAWSAWRQQWHAKAVAAGLEPEPCDAAEPAGALCLQSTFVDHCLTGMDLRAFTRWTFVLEGDRLLVNAR